MKILPPSFEVKNTTLFFKNIDLLTLVKQYDTPLKLTDLQTIENQVEETQIYFKKLRSKYGKIRHCLLPAPKYIVRDQEQKISVFRDKPSVDDVLKALRYFIND